MSSPPPTATMAESLGIIKALDLERGAEAMVIKTIDDVAASTVFNSVEFDAENKPKGPYTAAVRECCWQSTFREMVS